MCIDFIISTVTQGTECNNIASREIIKNNLLNLWRDSVYTSHKDYIIGVENGIAKVQYPNSPENRIHVASMGYDIISVSKDEAKRLWKSSVLVITEKLDLKEIADEIKQIY
ncbi:hypothetical protein HCY52_08405 [Acinetobacter radioresistens]|uniref:hypothetical protein n=1 Tax=Acinetobacter radioresistens TaxID=40216 RepID=UPI0020037CC6|nr:hypothetical protein [Acinetobacter radioresistens]MCK4083837.1 hypothetical protein [Acinetobacter radioresistens]